jgi:uncharacterized membrane-anchored protein YhcB (DUF1043 family)
MSKYYATGVKLAFSEYLPAYLRDLILEAGKKFNPSQLKPTLIGTALGTGTGALIDKEHRTRGAILGGLMGAGAGAGFGIARYLAANKTLPKFTERLESALSETMRKHTKPLQERIKNVTIPALEKRYAELEKRLQELEEHSARSAEILIRSPEEFSNYLQKSHIISKQMRYIQTTQTYLKRLAENPDFLANQAQTIKKRVLEEAKPIVQREYRKAMLPGIVYGIPAALAGSALVTTPIWAMSKLE